MANRGKRSGLSEMAASDTMSNASLNSSFQQMVRNDAGQVFEFKFPFRKEQLCDEPADPNRFWVKTRKNVSNWHEVQLLRDIEQVAESICPGGAAIKCLQIMDNDNFDNLYSIIYYLEQVSPTVRKEVLEVLNKGLRNLLKCMEKE